MKRWLLLALAVVLVWFAVGYFGAGSACAHDPRFVCSPRSNDPIHIADVTTSWAFYGHLAAGQRDVFTFRLRSAATVPWNLLVDARDESNPARPQATLQRGRDRIARLTFASSTTFYEPFSREHYLSTPTQRLRLVPGRYTIDVTIPNAMNPQRYVMAIGAQERFGILEIPYVFGAIHRIRALAY